jgi:hypothetical protein
MTLRQIEPGLLELVPELGLFVPPAGIVDKNTSPWVGTMLLHSLRAKNADTVVVSGAETDVFLRQLEPDGPTRLSLAHIGAIDRVAVGRYVIDTKRNEIASAQLAVDGQIEERQVARAMFELQLGADQPHVRRPQRRLRASELALVPGLAYRASCLMDGCRSWSVSAERPPSLRWQAATH